MRPPIDGTILITGASSGIGTELAKQFATKANELILVARRKERLEALAAELRQSHANLKVTVMSCDLVDRGQVDQMLETLKAQSTEVDVLVNNAGLGDQTLFDLAEWNRLETMIDLNVTAPTYLTHRLLPAMLEKGRGGILNVSSYFGFGTLPSFGVYIGTKHFISGWTETLRMELSGTGVVATQLCPGPVNTEFGEMSENKTGVESPGFFTLSAARCAKIAYRGFRRGRARVFPGILNRLTLALVESLPVFLVRLAMLPMARHLRRKLTASTN